MGRTFNLWDRREFKEAMEFGMINYCSKVVGTVAKLAFMIILDELRKSSIELSTGSRANIRRRVVRGALNLPPNLQACDLRAQRLDGSDQIHERKV
jgi:hypothetical protein